mmetsp:Transcript_6057/g.25726  ORF Transcript_6057/g.25726 Transcript_6057/m.25726 type:complete len:254 (+) Transcript_6057:213-974(+)
MDAQVELPGAGAKTPPHRFDSFSGLRRSGSGAFVSDPCAPLYSTLGSREGFSHWTTTSHQPPLKKLGGLKKPPLHSGDGTRPYGSFSDQRELEPAVEEPAASESNGRTTVFDRLVEAHAAVRRNLTGKKFVGEFTDDSKHKRQTFFAKQIRRRRAPRFAPRAASVRRGRAEAVAENQADHPPAGDVTVRGDPVHQRRARSVVDGFRDGFRRVFRAAAVGVHRGARRGERRVRALDGPLLGSVFFVEAGKEGPG